MVRAVGMTQTFLSPAQVDELVALNQYLKRTSEVTVHKLREEVDEAAKRLSFLLDYATLPGT